MIWFYGIITILIQTLLLRELVNLFRSNELTISILLFSWFIGTALGSSLFSRFPGFIKSTSKRSSLILLSLNLIFLALIAVIRFLYSFYQYQSEPNLFFLSVIFFAFTFPVAFLLGAGFTSLLQECNNELTYLYFVEGLAAFLGGLMFTFMIAGTVDAIAVASAMVFISALFLTRSSDIKLSIRILCLLGAGFILFVSPYITELSRKLEWRKNEALVFSDESRYGYAAQVENKGLFTTYYNGTAVYDSSSQSLYEENALLPVLYHENTKSICIVGIVSPEFMNYIKSINPDSITIVLADEVLTKIIMDSAGKNNSALKIITADPISYFNGCNQKFDLI